MAYAPPLRSNTDRAHVVQHIRDKVHDIELIEAAVLPGECAVVLAMHNVKAPVILCDPPFNVSPKTLSYGAAMVAT